MLLFALQPSKFDARIRNTFSGILNQSRMHEMNLKDTMDVFDKHNNAGFSIVLCTGMSWFFILQFMAELCWTGLGFSWAWKTMQLDVKFMTPRRLACLPFGRMSSKCFCRGCAWRWEQYDLGRLPASPLPVSSSDSLVFDHHLADAFYPTLVTIV